MSKIACLPTPRYYSRIGEWYAQQANKFLSCGEIARAKEYLSRADEYREKAGELRFEVSVEPEVVSCLPVRCNACDTPIYVPVHDYSETANYCYPCAWNRLGDTRESETL